MTPGKRNLEITRGDDYSHRIEFVLDGAPVDKSSCSYAAQIRTMETAVDDVAFVVDGSQLAQGVLVISLAASVTRNLPSLAVWDLQQTAPGPTVTTILKGSVVVTEDVTR